MFVRFARLRCLAAGGALAALASGLLGAACAPAEAGPWPREKGHAFLSAATRLSAASAQGPYASYSTTYLEYGLGRDYTIGFDIGHGVSGRGKAIFFLRRPIGELSQGHLIAGEIGLGLIAGEKVLRPGLSYGHGFSRTVGVLGEVSGWMSLESFAEFRLDTGLVDLKADFTLGFNHGARVKTIWQLQTGASHGDPAFLRLAPSLVMKMGRASHVELGLTAGLRGDDHYGVKLGFWRDF